MNRKTKVIIPLAALIMAICVLSIKLVSSNSVTFEDNSSFEIASETGSSDNNTISIVSSSITKVTNSKEYKKAGLDERIKLIDPVLKELCENEYLSDYEYSLDSPHPSVAYYYNNSKGGGVVIFKE